MTAEKTRDCKIARNTAATMTDRESVGYGARLYGPAPLAACRTTKNDPNKHELQSLRS